LGYVEVPCIPTAKNQPAQDFLDTVVSQYKQPLESGFMYRFPVEFAGSIAYIPGVEKPAAAGKSSEGQADITSVPSKQPAKLDSTSGIFQDIAMYLNDAEQILKAIALQSQKQSPKHTGQYLAPGSEIERSVIGIWKKVLGIDDIGINDNFFEIGGTSLKGVLLIAQINRDFKTNIPIIALFEKPTISSMAAMLAAEVGISTTNSSVLTK
jgi:acyl carrier protein